MQQVWNSVAPVADQSGAVAPGTGIRTAQEVAYEKIVRKFMRHDKISWMEVILFSLATQVTDAGAGAWLGKYTPSASIDFMGVVKEFVRPVGSVIAINYIFDIFKNGLRNPLKSFSLKELLIRLSAKNLAEGGQAVLAQNVTAAAGYIKKYEDLRNRQQLSARFRKTA